MQRGARNTVTIAIEERFAVLSGFQEDISLQYLTAGEGIPLVLLHGVGDSAESWRSVIPELARTHQVYAPSFPGSGESSKPEVDYSPAYLTVVLQRFLDTLGIERAIFVGNSLGGLVATRLALSTPTRVIALGLVDSAGLGRQLTLALRLQNLPGMGTLISSWNKTSIGAWQWAGQMAALCFNNPARVPHEWLEHVAGLAQRDGYLEATVALVRSASNLRGQLKREMVLDDLPRLAMPTLIIWGENDRVVRARQARKTVTRLPQGQLTIIPDCGHLPQLECPEEFVAILSQFLTRVTSAADTELTREASA